MIRKARGEDLETIVDMSRQFYDTTKQSKIIPFDADTVRGLSEGLMSAGVMLVAEMDGKVVGMIGLYVGPNMFNRHYISSHEVVWWLNPEARNSGLGVKLLKAIDPECKFLRSVYTQMVTLSTSPPQAAMMYEQAGYEHSESSYTKVT